MQLDIGNEPFLSQQLKADRPHPRNYPHTPTGYRHTDKHLRLVMTPIAVCSNVANPSKVFKFFQWSVVSNKYKEGTFSPDYRQTESNSYEPTMQAARVGSKKGFSTMRK